MALSGEESDIARIRAGWTMKDVINAFGEGQLTEIPVIIYPA